MTWMDDVKDLAERAKSLADDLAKKPDVAGKPALPVLLQEQLDGARTNAKAVAETLAKVDAVRVAATAAPAPPTKKS